eukprot:CAMPEP_0118708382 /NCGR_PEP_ID=MMETSP0800-20121206/21844_1 /TAXON_ID=210618 ORGANISM="Striatella unipunctata, Strain CCMP2910" /NCGR_SAMPLE_ID=MMETSP0800 /ASSEMBLY_ACC=CAM_ASM_000638 /LENGTH=250 /DNA_ID=CAMNT_0006611545 /DNA_START=13 /DNA_END=765 /DNA_ORIENTATION=+
MPSLKTFKQKSKKDAMAIVSSGVDTLKTMEAKEAEIFPYKTLSEASAAMSFETIEQMQQQQQQIMDPAVAATRDALEMGISSVMTFERFIGMHVPQMEDGNNFGVTVQMTVAKYLKETRTEFKAYLEEVPKYYAARAEALDKLGLPKASLTETSVEVTSSDKKKAAGVASTEEATKTSTTKESKTSSSSPFPDPARVQQLNSIQVQNYALMKEAFNAVMTGLMTVLDNMEKNSEKLETPKGMGSSGMGMY